MKFQKKRVYYFYDSSALGMNWEKFLFWQHKFRVVNNIIWGNYFFEWVRLNLLHHSKTNLFWIGDDTHFSLILWVEPGQNRWKTIQPRWKVWVGKYERENVKEVLNHIFCYQQIPRRYSSFLFLQKSLIFHAEIIRITWR